MENDNRGPWMLLASGSKFYPSCPRSDDVHLRDISHALSNICRFGGHTEHFYSVAQHAVLVSGICEQLAPDDPWLWYYGLHHDDAEAYTGDVITQIKYAVPAIRSYHKPIERAVARAMQCPEHLPPVIKEADLIALSTENRDLLQGKGLYMPPGLTLPEPLPDHIGALNPTVAGMDYISRHYQLWRICNDNSKAT